VTFPRLARFLAASFVIFSNLLAISVPVGVNLAAVADVAPLFAWVSREPSRTTSGNAMNQQPHETDHNDCEEDSVAPCAGAGLAATTEAVDDPNQTEH